jgi:hypothetical protein
LENPKRGSLHEQKSSAGVPTGAPSEERSHDRPLVSSAHPVEQSVEWEVSEEELKVRKVEPGKPEPRGPEFGSAS